MESGPTRPRIETCPPGRRAAGAAGTHRPPENPVGRTLDLIRAAYPEFVEQELPEVVDLAEARKTIASDAMHIDPVELHRVDDSRILRYDLTLPLLLTVRVRRPPLRIWAAGKAIDCVRWTRCISRRSIRRRCCGWTSGRVSTRGR